MNVRTSTGLLLRYLDLESAAGAGEFREQIPARVPDVILSEGGR